ncbi:YXWGXW repeat-containing protein [Gemmata sp. G18]|uniref:YXWGXW repeat-containing protein n=1 Tax=Gemmata palustris TaxID=2822762 RepID=A0ABS5BXJ9_9BACT|nr:YXWGXW repeat-containing protein [Gemmata palustris]MBP3958471.1 YXWGXW repeat-containing protein [Gemmata palustris]
MTERVLKVLPLGVFGALAFTLVAIDTAPAQEPIPLVTPGRFPVGQPDPVPLPLPLPGQQGQPVEPAQPVQPAQGEGIEVLAKGPVHEAFAATAEAPVASPVIAKQPPDPIEELPPDQKPEGDNVQWIPGYWGWDEENSQFIWVSGFWRQPPPGRVWVPGSWREARGGWQYVPGFWQELTPPQPQQPQQPQAQPEIEYLPQPPVTLEVGPTVEAPNTTSVYVPGSWVWRNKYVWRPGVWVEYRRDWVWVPARYHWTPVGYVFCDGYWDYPLATRGVLFAPVVISRPVYTRRAFVYTPVYVVSEPCMTGALFVRRGYGNYYFGDYFDNRYATGGYTAWCGTVGRNGFAIGFGAGRTWGYDPLWSYYSVHYRSTPRWQGGVNDLYAGRYRGDVARPPVTLVQQNRTINNITKTNVTNVTNNITVVNGASTVNNRDVSNVAMLAPLKVAPDLQRTKFEAVSAERRRDEATAAKQIREVAVQRTKLETAAVNQPKPMATPGTTQPPAKPQTIKLDVPKVAAQRAAVSTDEKKAPPPNPHRSVNTPGAKVDPKTPGTPLPKVDPKTPVNPPVNPMPKTDPPKVDPKAPVNPKIDPKPPVKPGVPPTQPPVNPMPKTEPPKVDPKPPVTPLPKVDPKPPVTPLPMVEPKPVIPMPKTEPPKVDPKPVNPPVPPKVELPKVNPPVVPKVDPKPPTQPPVTPLPKVEPKPPVNPPKVDPRPPVSPPMSPLPKGPVTPPVVPKGNPPAPPRNDPKPPPKSDPKPLAVVPVVNPQPKPVAVAPVGPPKTQPAPVAQPRPAAIVPTAPPMKVVQPPKAQPPAVQPKAQPAGKPAKKPR